MSSSKHITVVLTCLGNFQEYILDSIHNLVVHGNTHIVIITEPEFFSRFAEFHMVTLIDRTSLSDDFDFESTSKLDRSFRGGFWHLASARLFVLYAYLKTFNVERCLHIENDVMVYANADTLPWNPNGMSVVYDCAERVIPSVVWIPTPSTLRDILVRYNVTLNDMTNLARFDLEHLPIFPDSSTLGSPPFSEGLVKISCNYPRYGYVFDGAAMGQYIDGVDPRNQPGDTRGFVNETCIIKYNHYRFIWRRGRPFLDVLGQVFPIFNLHIHSKNLRKFRSNEKITTVALVLSSRGEPYDSFLENWKRGHIPPNVKVYYYFYSPDVTAIELRNDNELHIPGNESLVPGTYLKTLAAIRYVLEKEDFDYLLRPNLSSAFDFERLLHWLQPQPTVNRAFGPWMCDSFLSGCGFALTYDIAERFVKWNNPARPILVDDMMLKQFIDGQQIPHTHWDIGGLGYNEPNIQGHEFHYRFMTNTADRSRDIVNHRAAIEYFSRQTDRD